MPSPLAVVILAHDRPEHLRRLVAALDPFPVYLHVDARASEPMFRALTRDLPSRVEVLPRVRTGWAEVGLVVGEMLGYRRALEDSDAEHVALLSGTDYPLHSTDAIADRLRAHRGTSLVAFHELPYARWGVMRGYDRFLFPQWPRQRRRMIVPIPRPWPVGLRPAGGSQMKVLARRHAETLVRVVADRPDIRRYFTRVWIPDETLVPSILTSPALCPGFDEQSVHLPWFMEWGEAAQQSPAWLTDRHADALVAAARRPDGPLFARKFGDGSAALLDRIDAELRSRP